MSMVGDLVKGLFGVSSSSPKAPQAPDPNQVARDADAQAQQQEAMLQRGRTSTILTGSTGLKDLGTTSKTLLGQ